MRQDLLRVVKDKKREILNEVESRSVSARGLGPSLSRSSTSVHRLNTNSERDFNMSTWSHHVAAMFWVS